MVDTSTGHVTSLTSSGCIIVVSYAHFTPWFCVIVIEIAVLFLFNIRVRHGKLVLADYPQGFDGGQLLLSKLSSKSGKKKKKIGNKAKMVSGSW